MAWEPESFNPEQRRAAGQAITQAQIALYRLDRSEFGGGNVDMVTRVYSRVSDLLAMLYEDIYGLDGSGSRIPQPPSAS